MSLRLYLLALGLLMPVICQAQLEHSSIGGKALGLSNSTITAEDLWAVHNNIGALASFQKTGVGIGYSTRYGMSAFNTFYLVAATPVTIQSTKQATLGLGIVKMGNDLYSEQLIGVGIAKKINFMSLGAKINYAQININDPNGYLSNTLGAVLISIGGSAQLSKTIKWGLHGFNITQASLEYKQDPSPLPVILKTGLGYQPNDQVSINAEIVKSIEDKAMLRVGVEYQIYKIFAIRVGMQSAPFVTSVGIGFAPRHYRLDYGFQLGSALGFVHQISFEYTFDQLSKIVRK